MVDVPASIEGFADASQAQVMLFQSGRQVQAPALKIGLQPLDTTLTALSGTGLGSSGQYLSTNGSDFVWVTGATPWVTYTPTFTAFGTVSAVSIWSRRSGDTLHLRGKFTGGTSTGSEARMTLGFNGTNANVTSDATKVPSIQMAGAGTYSVASASAPVVLIESNVGYVTFGLQAGAVGGLTKANGNAFLASGAVFSFTAEIPISGW